LKYNRGLEQKMKRFSNLLVLAITIAGFLLASTAARADTTLTLIPSSQNGTGPTFIFDATVNNTGYSTVFLNGDFISGGVPLLTYVGQPPPYLDDSDFLNYYPYSLDPGESFSGELFIVFTPPYGSGSNYYTGTFEILGGIDDIAQDDVASANFDITVTGGASDEFVPEPSSLVLLLTGMAGLAGTIRRQLI
jgi:hypothetical protein